MILHKKSIYLNVSCVSKGESHIWSWFWFRISRNPYQLNNSIAFEQIKMTMEWLLVRAKAGGYFSHDEIS